MFVCDFEGAASDCFIVEFLLHFYCLSHHFDFVLLIESVVNRVQIDILLLLQTRSALRLFRLIDLGD